MIDYQIVEAVAIRVNAEDEKLAREREEEQKRQNWKNDRDHLKQYQ